MGSVEKSNANKEFSIALLIEDIKEAKELSDSLREIGIFAHYYQDLDDLWVSINTHTPDLCIVDVKKMSQGTLLFKQHPKVQNKNLKYAFYYKDSTQVLLNSTHGMDHYGLIRGELSLVDQLRSILRRRNQELKLTGELESLTNRISKLRKHSKRLSITGENDQATLSQYERLEKLIARFGRVNTVEEFSQRLVSFFNEWEECYQFGVYQLNSTKQKLVAPKARAEKYKILPDLWLSSVCESGIQDYAQEMAYEVSYGLMDENILANRIFGIEDNPDLLVIGQYNKEKLKSFNWDLLTEKLNSEYRKVLAKENMQEDKKSSVVSLFDMLQEMDDVQFYRADSNLKYVCLSFTGLIDFIKQSYTNRFSWKSFSTEFCSELAQSLNGDFKMSHMGVDAIIIGLDKKHVNADINRVKSFCQNFQFWRYFDDTSIIVTQNLAPEISFVTPSSVNLIRQAQDGFSNIMDDTNEIAEVRAPQIRRERQLEV